MSVSAATITTDLNPEQAAWEAEDYLGVSASSLYTQAQVPPSQLPS